MHFADIIVIVIIIITLQIEGLGQSCVKSLDIILTAIAHLVFR